MDGLLCYLPIRIAARPFVAACLFVCTCVIRAHIQNQIIVILFYHSTVNKAKSGDCIFKGLRGGGVKGFKHVSDTAQQLFNY